MNPTRDLTDFLLARIAEDERDPDCMGAGEYSSCARWSERRETENEVKRRLVAQETAARQMRPGGVPWDEQGWDVDGRFYVTLGRFHRLEGEDAERFVFEHTDQVRDTPTLRLLALPYADHPDYREEWRP